MVSCDDSAPLRSRSTGLGCYLIKRFQTDTPMSSSRPERKRACDSCRRRKCRVSPSSLARFSSRAKEATQLAVSRDIISEAPQSTDSCQATVPRDLAGVVQPASAMG